MQGRGIKWVAAAGIAFAFLPAYAATPLQVESEIVTDEWYPLPEEQIRTTVMDSALDTITATNQFTLGGSDGARKSARLRARITLVGPERIVQLGLRLDSPGQPTLVATSSMAVKGVGHQGFFGAFRYVGKQAGTEITDRLAARTEAPPVAESGEPTLADRTIARRFSEAKELERNGELERARKTFVAVTEMATDSQQKWMALARDELEFGLLVAEAQQLRLRLADVNVPLQEKERMARLAEFRLREAIAQNRPDPKRNSRVQRMLDQLNLTIKGLSAAKKAQAVSALGRVRVMISEMYMMRGRCPDASETRELTHRSPRKLSLEEAFGSEEDRRYLFVDQANEVTMEVRCREGRIELVGTRL